MLKIVFRLCLETVSLGSHTAFHGHLPLGDGVGALGERA